MNLSKTVVITGAANGIGKATSEYFLLQGWKVIATDKVKISSDADGLTSYPLDVTSVDEINKLSGWLIENAFAVDVLINCAGFYDMYPITESDPDKLKTIFEVNAFGAVNMIRALMPFLEKSKGRVINISSISVRIPWLFQPYQLSKITLEALSRAMRQELKIKGISLSIIRPGAIDTDFSKNSIRTDHDIENSAYRNEIKAFLQKAGKKMPKAISPEKVAEKLYRIATAKKPRYYYSINTDPFVRLMGMLPVGWQDWVVHRIIGR